MKSFDENINFLEKSPLFAMSLGSKELFHSNFWAWIIEQEEGRSFINVFFKDFDLSEFKEVKREDDNRDLVIRNNAGEEYVIENKIKSYPDKEQLLKYKCSQGVITGIKRPPFEVPDKWDFVDYKTIGQELKKLAPKFSDEHNRRIVDEYSEVVLAIDALIDESLKEKEGYLSFWPENASKLDRIRMMDVYKKAKADDFAVQCEDSMKTIKGLIKKEDWDCWISRSFHNGKATISFEIQKGRKDNYKGMIGVQIEGDQFRLFLGMPENKKMPVDEIFEQGKKIGWFDPDFEKNNKREIFGHQTKMKKNPCSYSNRWVYQYFDTWTKEHDLQQYDLLKKLIFDNLEKAVEIVNNNPIAEELFK